jgi:uncharacterized protein (DUF1015 family)
MEIRPFRAFRFDPAVVGNAGDCIAPPYDVIGPEQRRRLYRKSPYNIVRITKPNEASADNQYTRAADYLSDWIDSGVLKQDPAEGIYGYVQDFEVAGAQYQRLAFISLAKLEEFGPPGPVRPHEQTLSKAMLDRLNLKRATAADFGLVFMLYEDKKGIADRIIQSASAGPAILDCTDEQDVRHRLFSITAKKDVDAIVRMMRDKNCIIADGHHRYTTGLTYSKESPNPAAKYQMLAFTNMSGEGLIVLATHRLVANLQEFNMDRLLAGLGRNFQVTEFGFGKARQAKADASAGSPKWDKQEMLARMRAEHGKDKKAFGIYGPNSAFYAAVLKNARAMNAAAPHKSAAYRSLDVAVLHKLVLEELLGIDEEVLARGENLEYVKDAPTAIDDSIAQVDAGLKQAAFFMNPIKMQQLIEVTDAGERMPQKSTYFYPKMFTGVTINKL